MPESLGTNENNRRNYAAFWIFGFCNHFINYVMLVAAQDILNKHREVQDTPIKPTLSFHHKSADQCVSVLETRQCSAHSAGIVLLCNVLPAFIIKLSVPLIAYRFSYGMRQFFVCLLQAGALLVVAFASNVPFALVGVMLSSVAIGLGEPTFLALASHYPKNTICFWSSGTGLAGMIASLSYASMTDPHILGLSPTVATLFFLIIPTTYFVTYRCLLGSSAAEIHTKKSHSGGLESNGSSVGKSNSSIIPKGKDGSRWSVIKVLLTYMTPLCAVYFAEYFINQGLTELISFDCSHGFNKSPRTQYRWYQVVYRSGVFLSRSVGTLLQLSMRGIVILPILQFVNVAFFLANAIHPMVPHFGMIIGIVFYEGLIGGSAYVNTFSHIHRKVDVEIKEFTLSIVTLADTAGIVLAAVTAIPVHNAICETPYI